MHAQGRGLVYNSGRWQIDLGRRELLTGGMAVPIGSRAFEIIEILARSANNVVTKDDLMDRVWPGVTVGENTLQVHISAIRKVLGPDRKMLKTVSRRGYRLIGDWRTGSPISPAVPVVTVPEVRPYQSFQNNLPLRPGLIGRAAAVNRLLDLLTAYRVVTLTGPGGIGKTSLAIEVARDLSASFQGDIWHVELVSLSDAGLVASAVAGTVGLEFGGEAISAVSVARAIGRGKVAAPAGQLRTRHRRGRHIV